MLLVKSSVVVLVLAVGFVLAQEEALGPNGQPRPEPYSFKYSADASGAISSREETGDANGRITGVYTITGPDGRERRVEYVADADGYRATVKTNEIGTKPEDSGAAHWIVSQPSEAQLAASNNANLLNPNAGRPAPGSGNQQQQLIVSPDGSSQSGINSQLPTQQEQIASANNQGPAVIAQAPAEADSQQTLVNLDDIIDAPPQELPQQVLVQQQQFSQSGGPLPQFVGPQAPRPLFQQPQLVIQRQPLGPLPVATFASRQPAQLLVPQQPIQQVLIQQQQEAADQQGQEGPNGIGFGRQPARELVQLIQQQEVGQGPIQEPEQPQLPLPVPQFGNKGPSQIVQLQQVPIGQQQIGQGSIGSKGIAFGRQPPREVVQLIQQQELPQVVFNPQPAAPQPLPLEPVELQQPELPRQPLPAPQFSVKTPGVIVQQVRVQQQQELAPQPPRELIQLVQQQEIAQPQAPSQPQSNEPQLPEAQFESKEPEQPAPAPEQPSQPEQQPESPKSPAPAPVPAPLPAPAPLPVPIFTQVQIPARGPQPTKGGLSATKGASSSSGGRQQIIGQPQFIQIDRPQFIQQRPQFIQPQPLFIQQQQQPQLIRQQPQQQFIQQVSQFNPQPQFIPQSQLIQTIQEPEILAPNFSFDRIRPIQPQQVRPQQQFINTQFIQQQQQQQPLEPARFQIIQGASKGQQAQGNFGPLPVKGGSSQPRQEPAAPVRQEPAAPASQEPAAQEPAAPQEPASQEPAGQEPAQGPDSAQTSAGAGEQTSQNGDKVEVINVNDDKQGQSQQTEQNAPKSTETGTDTGSQQEAGAGQTETGSSQETGSGQADNSSASNDGASQEGGADQQPQTSAPTTAAPTTAAPTTVAPTTTTTAAPSRRLVFGKGRFGKPAGVKFGTKGGAQQQQAALQPAPLAPQPQPIPAQNIQQQAQQVPIKGSGSQFVSFGTRLGTKSARAN